MDSSKSRRYLLYFCAVFSVLVGAGLGMTFMGGVLDLFDSAIHAGTGDPYALLYNLAQVTKGILGWIVFGLAITNAVVVASAFCIVDMVLSSGERR
ncbi:MAG: hypothetical protein D6679_02980 [Candidatus Hydrogenedentota bacterium]|nr:MAG: hypothetical protein D6679_02980 [Candidatus Hydrogenedentota bacterium]